MNESRRSEQMRRLEARHTLKLRATIPDNSLGEEGEACLVPEGRGTAMLAKLDGKWYKVGQADAPLGRTLSSSGGTLGAKDLKRLEQMINQVRAKLDKVYSEYFATPLVSHLGWYDDGAEEEDIEARTIDLYNWSDTTCEVKIQLRDELGLKYEESSQVPIQLSFDGGNWFDSLPSAGVKMNVVPGSKLAGNPRFLYIRPKPPIDVSRAVPEGGGNNDEGIIRLIWLRSGVDGAHGEEVYRHDIYWSFVINVPAQMELVPRWLDMGGCVLNIDTGGYAGLVMEDVETEDDGHGITFRNMAPSGARAGSGTMRVHYAAEVGTNDIRIFDCLVGEGCAAYGGDWRNSLQVIYGKYDYNLETWAWYAPDGNYGPPPATFGTTNIIIGTPVVDDTDDIIFTWLIEPGFAIRFYPIAKPRRGGMPLYAPGGSNLIVTTGWQAPVEMFSVTCAGIRGETWDVDIDQLDFGGIAVGQTLTRRTKIYNFKLFDSIYGAFSLIAPGADGEDEELVIDDEGDANVGVTSNDGNWRLRVYRPSGSRTLNDIGGYATDPDHGVRIPGAYERDDEYPSGDTRDYMEAELRLYGNQTTLEGEGGVVLRAYLSLAAKDEGEHSGYWVFDTENDTGITAYQDIEVTGFVYDTDSSDALLVPEPMDEMSMGTVNPTMGFMDGAVQIFTLTNMGGARSRNIRIWIEGEDDGEGGKVYPLEPWGSRHFTPESDTTVNLMTLGTEGWELLAAGASPGGDKPGWWLNATGHNDLEIFPDGYITIKMGFDWFQLQPGWNDVDMKIYEENTAGDDWDIVETINLRILRGGNDAKLEWWVLCEQIASGGGNVWIPASFSWDEDLDPDYRFLEPDDTIDTDLMVSWKKIDDPDLETAAAFSGFGGNGVFFGRVPIGMEGDDSLPKGVRHEWRWLRAYNVGHEFVELNSEGMSGSETPGDVFVIGMDASMSYEIQKPYVLESEVTGDDAAIPITDPTDYYWIPDNDCGNESCAILFPQSAIGMTFDEGGDRERLVVAGDTYVQCCVRFGADDQVLQLLSDNVTETQVAGTLKIPGTGASGEVRLLGHAGRFFEIDGLSGNFTLAFGHILRGTDIAQEIRIRNITQGFGTQLFGFGAHVIDVKVEVKYDGAYFNDPDELVTIEGPYFETVTGDEPSYATAVGSDADAGSGWYEIWPEALQNPATDRYNQIVYLIRLTAAESQKRGELWEEDLYRLKVSCRMGHIAFEAKEVEGMVVPLKGTIAGDNYWGRFEHLSWNLGEKPSNRIVARSTHLLNDSPWVRENIDLTYTGDGGIDSPVGTPDIALIAAGGEAEIVFTMGDLDSITQGTVDGNHPWGALHAEVTASEGGILPGTIEFVAKRPEPYGAILIEPQTVRLVESSTRRVLLAIINWTETNFTNLTLRFNQVGAIIDATNWPPFIFEEVTEVTSHGDGTGWNPDSWTPDGIIQWEDGDDFYDIGDLQSGEVRYVWVSAYMPETYNAWDDALAGAYLRILAIENGDAAVGLIDFGFTFEDAS